MNPLRPRLEALQVGESFITAKASLKTSVYVSHWAKSKGRRYRTRRVELGRRVERLS